MKDHEIFIRLDVPSAAFHDDVGYHYSKGKKKYERIAPDDFINTLDPGTIRNCVGTSPSNYVFGPGIDLAKYSFPLGPQLEYSSGNDDGTNEKGSRFYRNISNGTVLQLYCVFIDKNGKPVPGWIFDGRKQKYNVFVCPFMTSDKNILGSFEEFLSYIGLSGWLYKNGQQKSKSNFSNVICQGSIYTKIAIQSPTVTSVPGLCYSAADRIIPILGQSMVMSEDGILYFGINPQMVPSATHEIYPLLYASLNEPGMTSSKGPSELFLVHFQFPVQNPVISLNQDIIIDKGVLDRLSSIASMHKGTYLSESFNFTKGKFTGYLGDSEVNPLMLVRDQVMQFDGVDHFVSIQGLNMALIDAPVVYRVLQLYVVKACGVDATRLSCMDPDDEDAMLAHRVDDWLESRGVLHGPSLHHVCNALTEAVVKAFDDPVLFNALMAHVEQLNAKKIDKSGLYNNIKSTLLREIGSLCLSLVVKLSLQKDQIQKEHNGQIDIDVPLLISFHE